jgi:hypothetical protein
MRFGRVLMAVCLAGLALAAPARPAAASGGKGNPGDAPLAVPIEKQQPVRIGTFDAEPVIDGKLDDAVWKSATVLKDFFQIQPGDNIAPTQSTEVLVAHDAKHLYLAFHCHDTEASKVRATIPKRDQIFDDDYVGAYLDTFHDQRRAYAIFFNPLGVQADGIFTEDRGEDYSVDIVMESKGTVDEDGYTIEIAIPFKSLRYESGADKTWGLQLFRRIKRGNNELDSWMPISRSRSGTLNQAGQLSGFEGISTERTLEIIPSVTFSEAGHRIAASTDGSIVDTSRILNKPAAADLGLTLKYSITPTVTLDFAANPDFAQVEADALVVTANQRFPIFYEEKRPFFLEGIDIFQTQMNVLNTRRIVDPDVAVKLSGKEGRTTFGLLLASDNAPGNYSDEERGDPNLRPSIERYLDQNSTVGVLRLKRDVGAESSVGLMATTYNFVDRHNNVVSLDGRFKIDPKTVLNVQTVGTTTRGYFYDGDLRDSIYRTGNGVGYALSWDYTDRNFGYQVNAVGRTRDYLADVGFTRRVDTNRDEVFLRFSSDPKTNSNYLGHRAINISGVNYDWKGRLQNWDEEFQYRWNFKRDTFYAVGAMTGYERLFESEFRPYLPASYPSGFAGTDPERSTRKNQIYGYTGSTPTKQFSYFAFVAYTRGNFDLDFGGGPNFPRVSEAALANPAAAFDPGPGNELYIESTFSYQPTDALRASISYYKDRLTRQDTGLTAFDDNIFSLRTTYQFSRFTFVRARLDYDSLSSHVYGQYLFGWAPNPGTSFYVGYNDDHNLNGYSPFTGVHEPGLVLNGRTFFVKMSYLFRQSI